MKKCLFVINPASGRQTVQEELLQIISKLTAAGYLVTVVPTEYPGHGTNIAHRYSSDYDLVVVSGGDGTLNEVVNGIMRAPKMTPLGYIPAGTANDFARTLHLPSDPMRAVDAIIEGSLHPFDVGKFNNHYFIYVSAFGAFTDVAYSTPQQMKNLLGKFAYFVEGIKKLPDIAHPYQLDIQADEASYSGDYVFVSVSNTLSLGGIVQFDPADLSLSDGYFELMLIKMPENPLRLQRIVYGLFNQEYDSEYIQFAHGKNFSISSTRPMAWTTDGESGGLHFNVNIEVAEEKIELVY